ncbi:MAG: polysaccharide deacetylase family protein [Bacteroidales bacterium]
MDKSSNRGTDFKDLPSVSLSFDFETSAQTADPVLKSKIKSRLINVLNHLGFTEKDLSGGFGRGYGNRIGAEMILKIFKKYNIKATWFSTGHVLLRGNKNRQGFRINQKLPYALAEAGFSSATTWRVLNPSFYHEPFSNYRKFPYYYLGDLAQKLKQEGHDIQCHSFSHPYISMEPIGNIKKDLEDWQNLAEKIGFGRSRIFAFPFLGDYHYTDPQSGLKMMPSFRKQGRAYEISYLDEGKLEIFKNAGFELFTRCGTMQNYGLLSGFIPYRNSEIYCMKDIGLLSFKDNAAFMKFLDEVFLKKATVDMWLHPNDILIPQKLDLFKSYVDTLVQYRDHGKIWLCTISEQWERFKREKHLINNL